MHVLRVTGPAPVATYKPPQSPPSFWRSAAPASHVHCVPSAAHVPFAVCAVCSMCISPPLHRPALTPALGLVSQPSRRREHFPSRQGWLLRWLRCSTGLGKPRVLASTRLLLVAWPLAIRRNDSHGPSGSSLHPYFPRFVLCFLAGASACEVGRLDEDDPDPDPCWLLARRCRP